jgi:hypothetical protein
MKVRNAMNFNAVRRRRKPIRDRTAMPRSKWEVDENVPIPAGQVKPNGVDPLPDFAESREPSGTFPAAPQN